MHDLSATVPAIYREGHAKARLIDRDLADAYVAHTLVGDPPADAALASLTKVDERQRTRIVEAMVMNRDEELRDAPREVRDFVSMVVSPDAAQAAEVRLDLDLARAGSTCFCKDMDMFVISLIGVGSIENLASLISRSFISTGYTTQQSVRRLRQSLLQVVDSMLPGGLDRQGDGFRLTIRARLAHAQARRFLLDTEDWKSETDGVPISGAHLALAMATFSARTLHGVDRLGVVPAGKEREGYMHIWRYIGWLVGVPPALLPADEAEALALARIGMVCEPPPDVDSIIMTHTVVNSTALTLAIEDDDKRRRRELKKCFRLFRALIGHELADQLEFPKMHTFGFLSAIRCKRRVDMALGRFSPRTRAEKFMFLLEATAMRNPDVNFDLPDLGYS